MEEYKHVLERLAHSTETFKHRLILLCDAAEVELYACFLEIQNSAPKIIPIYTFLKMRKQEVFPATSWEKLGLIVRNAGLAPSLACTVPAATQNSTVLFLQY